MIQLRGYQNEAIQALYDYFDEHDGNPIVELPTGAGKSIIVGAFTKITKERWPITRILILTHVKELIEQNYSKLMALWPEAPAGIYSASLKRKDKNHDIIFAGIQSIYKKAFDFDRFDLVIIDEVHMVPAKDNGTYRKFIADLKHANPLVKIIGLTATPYRLDNGSLIGGKQSIFTDIVYTLPVKKLLNDGYLAPVTTEPPSITLDLSSVKSRVDYVLRDQEEAANDPAFTSAAIKDILHHGKTRKSWLIFCPTVSYAKIIHDRLSFAGVSCELVTGDTPKQKREQVLAQYKSGMIKALINVDVLTTGFDAPQTDLLVLLRSTKSISLYVQIIGRGMRIAEDKTDCLVLDFGNNVDRHGPIDSIVPPKHKDKQEKGEAPTKNCPKCKEIMLAFAKVCPGCGYEFPAKPLHESAASTAAILSEVIKPEWRPVQRVEYTKHWKPGKKTSLKVSYLCGIKFVHEWIFIEHMGAAQTKAAHWWNERSKSLIPVNVSGALDHIDAHGLREPKYVLVKREGKHEKVIDYDFTGQLAKYDQSVAQASSA